MKHSVQVERQYPLYWRKRVVEEEQSYLQEKDPLLDQTQVIRLEVLNDPEV